MLVYQSLKQQWVQDVVVVACAVSAAVLRRILLQVQSLRGCVVYVLADSTVICQTAIQPIIIEPTNS